MELGGALSRLGTTSVEAETTTGVHLTEITTRGDPRAYSPQMTATKKAEIKNLLERGTFKVILKEEIPPDGNILPGRFVLSVIIWIPPARCWSVAEKVSSVAVNYNTTSLSRGWRL